MRGRAPAVKRFRAAGCAPRLRPRCLLAAPARSGHTTDRADPDRDEARRELSSGLRCWRARGGVGDDNTPNDREPRNLSVGVTVVGKRARIPAGCRSRATAGSTRTWSTRTSGTFVPIGGTVFAWRALVGRYAARPGRAYEV